VQVKLHGLTRPFSDIVLFSFSSLEGGSNLALWSLTGDRPSGYLPKLSLVGETVRVVFVPNGTLILVQ